MRGKTGKINLGLIELRIDFFFQWQNGGFLVGGVCFVSLLLS